MSSAQGHEKIARKLLENGAAISALGLRSSGTALYLAVDAVQENLVRVLLEYGADVNLADKGLYGTLLQLAWALGHETIAQILLEHGASVPSIEELVDAGRMELFA